MVWNVFGHYAMRYGRALGEFIAKDREAHDDKELWSGFQYLFDALREFEARKRGAYRPDFPREELERYLKEEMQMRLLWSRSG